MITWDSDEGRPGEITVIGFTKVYGREMENGTDEPIVK